MEWSPRNYQKLLASPNSIENTTVVGYSLHTRQIMLPRKQLESGRNKQKTSGQGKFARNAVFGPCFFPDRYDDLPSNPVFESQNNRQDFLKPKTNKTPKESNSKT